MSLLQPIDNTGLQSMFTYERAVILGTFSFGFANDFNCAFSPKMLKNRVSREQTWEQSRTQPTFLELQISFRFAGTFSLYSDKDRAVKSFVSSIVCVQLRHCTYNYQFDSTPVSLCCDVVSKLIIMYCLIALQNFKNIIILVHKVCKSFFSNLIELYG